MEEKSYFPVILNRVVPQDAHFPLKAWRPFLKVTNFAAVISLFFFSFTQKARVIAYHDRSRMISEGQPHLVNKPLN